MDGQENPDAAPPVEPGTAAEPSAEPLAAAPAPSEPVLLENPHAVAAAPSESMEGVVTVEQGTSSSAAPPALELEPVTVSTAATLAEPATLENPTAPTPAPSEGTADVVTLEASTPATAPSSSAEPLQSAATAPSPPQPVRVLPRRPRLRATFHYDARDELNVELTLMDDRRELIHRLSMTVTPGGAIARICEALLGVVTSAAAAAGVFGSRER